MPLIRKAGSWKIVIMGLTELQSDRLSFILSAAGRRETPPPYIPIERSKF